MNANSLFVDIKMRRSIQTGNHERGLGKELLRWDKYSWYYQLRKENPSLDTDDKKGC